MRRFFGSIGITFLLLLCAGFASAGEKVYFYVTDPAGTPLVETDATGTVTWRASYMPFGEETIEVATDQNNKMFVGKEKDSESGLYYFGARYNDPTAGRFIAPDSVGPVDPQTGKINQQMLLNPQMLNRYAYSLNNPYRYVDPDGKNPILIGVGLIMLGEMMFPRTMESPYRDSFLDQHWLTIATLGIGGAEEGAASLAAKVGSFASVAERQTVLRSVVTAEGTLRTSQTVARQLANERSYIPMQSILDTIGSGVRVADPQGVAGQFMYRSEAMFNGAKGTLEVLVNESVGEIRHVLFRSL